MLQLIVADSALTYPKVDWSFAKPALWAAFPTAIVSPAGKIRAANRLASWIGGKDPAPALIGSSIIDLSLHMVGEQQIPPECNMELLLKKGEVLAELDPHGSTLVTRIFQRWRVETANAASAEFEGTACPVFRSQREFDKRRPWQYPVRMYTPAGFEPRTLLEFAVLEVKVGRNLLIVLEPDDALTKSVITPVYAEQSADDSDGSYVFGLTGVDTSFPEEYDGDDLTNVEIAIASVDNDMKGEIASREAGFAAISAHDEACTRIVLPAEARETTIFAPQANQQFSEHDRQRITRVINAEDVALPIHPELGLGYGFRLRTDATPGHVTQVDVYQRRSDVERAVVRVHRTDDFGDPYAPRYTFDVGYLRQGTVPALAFQTIDDDRQRVVTIYEDGRFSEDVQFAGQSSAVAVPALHALHDEEKPLADDAAREWLTMGEATALMDISWSYARKLIADGVLHATRRGKVWFVDPDSARSFQRKRLRTSA